MKITKCITRSKTYIGMFQKAWRNAGPFVERRGCNMSDLQSTKNKKGKEYGDNLAGFIMSSPAIILLIAFLIIPIIYTIHFLHIR